MNIENNHLWRSLNIKKFDEELYLVDMYEDGYFPNFLVDKIKAMLMEIVHCFENAKYAELNLEAIQSKFDEFTETINGMHEEFHENGSELETVARESICETVRHIVIHFAQDIQAALLRNREW